MLLLEVKKKYHKIPILIISETIDKIIVWYLIPLKWVFLVANIQIPTKASVSEYRNLAEIDLLDGGGIFVTKLITAEAYFGTLIYKLR